MLFSIWKFTAVLSTFAFILDIDIRMTAAFKCFGRSFK